MQPVAVFEDNIEEAVNDDADFWDEIGGPEVPIFQDKGSRPIRVPPSPGKSAD